MRQYTIIHTIIVKRYDKKADPEKLSGCVPFLIRTPMESWYIFAVASYTASWTHYILLIHTR